MKVIKIMKFDNQIQPSSLHVLSREEPEEQRQQGSSVIYLVLAEAKTKVLPLGKEKDYSESSTSVPNTPKINWISKFQHLTL